jgi:hypothetical protein
MDTTLRPSDIVKQLKLYLPRYTDLFSVPVSVQSASAIADRTVRVTTTDTHTYQVGNPVIITAGLLNNSISGVEFRENDTIARFTTDQHDLTAPQKVNDVKTVTLSGFTNAAWNTTHSIQGISDRTHFDILVPTGEGIPVLTGSEVLYEDRPYGIKGVWNITAVTATTFDFEISPDIPVLPVNDITELACTIESRIYHAANFPRAKDIYTKNEQTVLFVVMDPVSISNDRKTTTDAVANLTSSNYRTLQMLQNINVVIFINTKNDIAGTQAQEKAYGELFEALLKTLFAFRKDNSKSRFLLIPTEHGQSDYNTEYYSHTYSWQLPQDINILDGFLDPQDVAFRDINEYNLPPFNPDNPATFRLRINLDS